jgi:antibiotic biosynthesis monooxygenase (ABM) superfamily enzyme
MNISKQTVSIVRNRIHAEKIATYLVWQSKITEACSQFEGYLNTTYIEPGLLTQNGDEYIVIFTFKNQTLLNQWKKSVIRTELLFELKSYTKEESIIQTFSGLEHWFLTADQSPSRVKMTLVSFLAIWPLVHFIPPLLAPFLYFPALINETITTAVITLCMSYIALPAMTKIFKRWLFN